MEYLKMLQSAAQGVPAVLARLYSALVIMFGFLGAALYWVTVPLRYPAYYAFAIISRALSVLFSPLWFTWRMFSGTTLMVVNFLSGLKVCMPMPSLHSVIRHNYLLYQLSPTFSLLRLMI